MHVGYLSNLTPNKFNKTVREMARLIKSEFPGCNALMGRGISGLMIVPVLAAKLKVEWMLVRKAKSHSDFKAEVSKWRQDTKVVFVDDLIDTGASCRESLDVIESLFRRHEEKFPCSTFQFLGAALYDGPCMRIRDGRKTVYLGEFLEKGE